MSREESEKLLDKSPRLSHPTAERQSLLDHIRSVDVRTWLFIYALVCLLAYNVISVVTLVAIGSAWTLFGCLISSVNWGFLVYAAVSKKSYPLKLSKFFADLQLVVILIFLFTLILFTLVLLFIKRTSLDDIVKQVFEATGIDPKLSALSLTVYSLLASILFTLDMYLRAWLINESLAVVEVEEVRKGRLHTV